MIRPRSSLLAALAIASVIVTGNARAGAQTPPRPGADPDHARLAAMTGAVPEWKAVEIKCTGKR